MPIAYAYCLLPTPHSLHTTTCFSSQHFCAGHGGSRQIGSEQKIQKVQKSWSDHRAETNRNRPGFAYSSPANPSKYPATFDPLPTRPAASNRKIYLRVKNAVA